MSNRLINEKSPYLLQHAENPVDWFPWGEEAFEKADRENKPVFLSIGYSTCHWCHVMAHESFEDIETAHIINKHFIAIKVDREERPDIDNVYMRVCQAMTGGGGWPTSLFLTPDKKPFFAGTYFPPLSRYGMVGFRELLLTITDKWENDKIMLLDSAEQIVEYLQPKTSREAKIDNDFIGKSIEHFKQLYDKQYGGFGEAPKFPTPHNLLYLLLYGKLHNDKAVINMVAYTLVQMRKGGIFDHIGHGFSRYSTDAKFLVPHFEKMLYDNALLILSYCAGYSVTKNSLFLDTAKKTADYVLREMTSPEGAFYSAQDADSEGGEGVYYVFDYDEIIKILGEEIGNKFNKHFGISKGGNFEGKNIPNRLDADNDDVYSKEFDTEISKIYEYRKNRFKLHLDDKILTSWNSLMIIAMSILYRVCGDKKYFNAAKRAEQFIQKELMEKGKLFVSFRDGKKSKNGFLDDYALYSAALIAMYDITQEEGYLDKAKELINTVINQFSDDENGGYFFSGSENENLILDTKETYDGAIPSGNSVLYYDFVRLSQLSTDDIWQEKAAKQMVFLAEKSQEYPTGHSMFLFSLLYYRNPPPRIIVVCSGKETPETVITKLPLFADIQILPEPTNEYKSINDKTTFYVCKNHMCLPPVNSLDELD